MDANDLHLYVPELKNAEQRERIQAALDIANGLSGTVTATEALTLIHSFLQEDDEYQDTDLAMALIRLRQDTDTPFELQRLRSAIATRPEFVQIDPNRAIEVFDLLASDTLQSHPDGELHERLSGERLKRALWRRTLRNRGASAAIPGQGDYPALLAMTHRAKSNRPEARYRFGSTEGPLAFAELHVNTPPREWGATPRRPLVHAIRNPRTDMWIEDAIDLDIQPFQARLAEMLEESGRRELLVFIHGYRNTFEDAALRCAQLQADLEIDGASVLYSWPSFGSILDYIGDQNRFSRAMAGEVARGILELVNGAKPSRVILLGHSMGAEYLLRVLEEMWLKIDGATPETPPFQHIVLASPDTRADDIRWRSPLLKRLAQTVTVYCSEHDRALAASTLVRRTPRAGAAPSELNNALVEVIDTGPALGDLIRHTDFAGPVLPDLQSLLWLDLPLDKRKLLEPITSSSSADDTIWRFKNPTTHEALFDAYWELIRTARRVGSVKAATFFGDVIASLDRNTPDSERDFLALVHALATEVLPSGAS